MLDMLYMGRPVLLVHYPQDITHLPLDEMGIAFSSRIDDAVGLETEMQRALYDLEQQKRHLEALIEEFPPLPCAPRIAEIIANAVHRSSTKRAGHRLGAGNH
jgi:hypothetical protein